ncbi:MAG: hypothetical protein HYS21_08770 [Deltaproteobacteria bacterium]|nr:hypothetical protein [Deltaproteobacteria bacterium]
MSDKKAPESLDTIKDGVENKVKKHVSRRSFFKKALVTTVAVTATAGLAKKASTLIPTENFEKLYLNDVLPGDIELAKRQYVLMTEQEKAALVRDLESNYKNKA